MKQTMIEKIISVNLQRYVYTNETVWLKPDLVTARDFAGPNAVLTFEKEFPDEPLFDPNKILFTLDCGHDLKYTNNQDIIRKFAKKRDIKISEIDHGIGTHVLIESGLAYPGRIITGTDSHFGILGAVGALGIAVGDTQTAFAFKTGLLEYTIPETIKVNVIGRYNYPTSAKDLTLYIVKKIGAKGALGKVIEFSGETIDNLDIAGRITLASLGAEMSATTVLISPNKEVLDLTRQRSGIENLQAILPDDDANYSDIIEVDIDGLTPQVARPGDPRDVVPVSEIGDVKINQVLIGSCTNGNYEDIKSAAEILKGNKVKNDVRLYIVPAGYDSFKKLEKEGILKTLSEAGAVIYPPACAGCTSEQVGKLGKNTVAVDTGNRNFTDKQGPGKKYITSPETAAASAIAGKIVSAEKREISPNDILDIDSFITEKKSKISLEQEIEYSKPIEISGNAWVIGDGSEIFKHVDTDAIYHNSRLQVTDPNEMGQYTFEQFEKFEKRAELIKNVQNGDIVIAGENFGSGSSREHAVKCFISLGIAAIVGKSFAPIYKNNAETLGFPLIECPEIDCSFVSDGDRLTLNLEKGIITNETTNKKIKGKGLSKNYMLKYQAGGLFGLAKHL